MRPETDYDLLFSAVITPLLQQDPIPAIPRQQLLSCTRILWGRGTVSPSIVGMKLLDRQEGADADALYKLGCWELHLGHSAEGKTYFERAICLAPEEPLLRLGYAHALFHLKDFERSAAEFEVLVSSRPDLKGPPVMAESARRLARGLEPEELMMSPLPGLPDGVMELFQIHLLQGAEAACRRTDSISGPVDETTLPRLRLRLEYLVELDRVEEAIRLAETIMATYPFDGMTSYLKGIALRQKGDRDASFEAFARATLFGPFEARAWGGVGAGCLERNESVLAEKNFRVALFLDQENPMLWADFGICCYLQEKFTEAEEATTKAIELGAATFGNFVNRAFARAKLGNPDSLTDYRKALAVAPNHPSAQAVRDLLADLPEKDDRFAYGPLDA